MRPFVLAVLVAVVLPAAASAGTPFSVGTGERPAVAISSDDGTAHLVWKRATRDTEVLVYCRLPRAATTCGRTQDVPLGGRAAPIMRPFVFARTPASIVLGGTGGGIPDFPAPMYAAESGDRGQSFSSPRVIGDLGLTNEQQFSGRPYALGPGAAVSAVADNTGVVYQRMPLDAPASRAAAVLTSALATSATTGLAGLMPVVAADVGDDVLWWRYSGSGSTEDAADWTGPVTLAGESDPRLVDGAGGLALLTTRTSDHAVLVRRFDGATFAAPTALREPGFEVDGAQTASGRLAIVYRLNGFPARIRVARSTDAGFTRFTAPVDVASDDDVFGLQLALAADGSGVVTWDQLSAGGAIRVARVDPGAGTAPSGPARTTAVVGATEIAVTIARGCLPVGPRFLAQVTTADLRRLTGSRPRVRVTRAEFVTDRVLRATDGAAPFLVKLPTLGLRPGRHTLTVRLTLRRVERPRTTSRKTIAVGVTVC